MNVGQLKKLLATIPDDTLVVKFHSGPEGYDEVHFAEGTHRGHGHESDYLKANRAKWVRGEARPDFLWRDDQRRSRAALLSYLLLY